MYTRPTAPSPTTRLPFCTAPRLRNTSAAAVLPLGSCQFCCLRLRTLPSPRLPHHALPPHCTHLRPSSSPADAAVAACCATGFAGCALPPLCLPSATTHNTHYTPTLPTPAHLPHCRRTCRAPACLYLHYPAQPRSWITCCRLPITACGLDALDTCVPAPACTTCHPCCRDSG